MNRNFGRLQEETGEALQEALKETHPISRYRGCIRILESAGHQLKEMVVTNPFATREDEIHHFKHEAPEIYSQLFYYLELNRLETDRDYCDPKAFLAVLRRKKIAIDEYFQEHDAICRYYSQGSAFQDDYLFIRRPTGQFLGDEIGTFIPPDFTIGTHWFSFIKANMRLRDWIREELAKGEAVWEGESAKRKPKLRWTGTRADLILLLCALSLTGCFNNGELTLKQIMEWGEEEFA